MVGVLKKEQAKEIIRETCFLFFFLKCNSWNKITTKMKKSLREIFYTTKIILYERINNIDCIFVKDNSVIEQKYY